MALILDNGGVTGLYVTQAWINENGTIIVPEFMVPGLTVKGVNVALVPTLDDNPEFRAERRCLGFQEAVML